MSYRLSKDSVTYALAHMNTHNDTDILPRPFEIDAMLAEHDEVADYLTKQDLDLWATGQLRSCLSPKNYSGFRVATQLDPYDTALLTALVREAGADFESARLDPAEGIVHSFRFDPSEDGRLYSREFTYETFRQKSLELAERFPKGWVVITDISDFYHRLYLHPVENAMRAATDTDRARVIGKLLSNWNDTVSHGVPVGSAAVRLIAELAINDVDQSLRSDGYLFCRYSDDYRIFAKTEGEAQESLVSLADVLWRNHQLTLQSGKTEAVPTEEFIARFKHDERDQVRQSLMGGFDELLAKLGVDTYGEAINYDDLEPELQGQVDSLNLVEILETQVKGTHPLDISLTRFVLGRLAQLGIGDVADMLLQEVRRLYPVFPLVMAVIEAEIPADDARAEQVGERVLGLLQHPLIGPLPFYRAWILSLFAHSSRWDQSDHVLQILSDSTDDFIRREAILALGRAGHAHWFKKKKQDLRRFGDWERRAFLAAASCLPGDEAKHWYRSVRPRLSHLEVVVVDWARQGGFD